MAKYKGKYNHPTIVDPILAIVKDAYDCYKRDYLNMAHMHPMNSRFVQLRSHRRAGHTSAAIKLLDIYEPSLLVAPTRVLYEEPYDSIMLDIRKNTNANQTVRFEPRCVPTHQFIQHVKRGGYRENYKLIIFDNATAIKNTASQEISLFELYEYTFRCCELIVELN